MKRIFFGAVLMAATWLVSCSPVKVFEASSSAAAKNEGGIMYTLPQTKIRVEAVAGQSLYERGSLYLREWLLKNKTYLQRYLDYDGDNIIDRLKDTNKVVLHTLKDADVTLKAIPVVDPNKSYLVQVNKKITRGTTLTLKLGEDALLQSGDVAIDDQTFEIFTGALTGVGRLAVNIVGAPFGLSDKGLKDGDKTSKLPCNDTVCVLNRLLDTLVVLEQKEMKLKSGETAVGSVDVLKELFESLNKARLEILSLIAYSETTKKTSYLFDVTPAVKESLNNFRLFAFTTENGLTVDGNCKEEGKRYYMVQVPGNTKGANVYYIGFTPRHNSNAAVLQKAPVAGEMTDYYRYNVPAKANAKLSKANKIVTNLEATFPQWGSLGYLKTKDAKTVFALDGFGALTSITLERKATLSPDRVSAASDLADKLTKKKDKDQEKIDELTKKKTLLELQKQIAELEKPSEN